MDGNWDDQGDSWETWGDQPDLKPQPKPEDKKKEEEDEAICDVRPESGEV
jgi:hypothetical protein